jgi:hypothetical protein
MVVAQKHIGQWNRMEDTEIKPHSYSHLILDKGAKNKHCKKASLITGAGISAGYLHAEDYKN